MSFLGTCEESIVKWRGYMQTHIFELTLLDEKLLSKVAADYLRLIKNLGSVYLNLTYLLFLIIKILKKNSNYLMKKATF